MNIEEFMLEMDTEKPQWFVDYADEQELKTFARWMTNKNATFTKEHHIERLRFSVASRLFSCARATHQWLLKQEKKEE